MSYILEAIKKSDRERQRNLSSSLAVPQSEFRTRRPAAHGAAWVVAASLMVASGIGGALLATSWRGAGADAGISQDAALAGSESLPATVGTPSTVAAAAPEAGTPGSVAPATANPVAAMPTIEDISAPALGLLEIWQLGEAEQRYLGELDVSFHVWSSDPQQRAAIVNGLRAKEGQSLGQDLRLIEITEDGLIVEFQGKHVHLATVHAS